MGKYKVILWDIDDTLLDFKKSEKNAIITCMKNKGFYADDTIAKRFSIINESFWKRLEKGEITKEQVLKGRFLKFFSELSLLDKIDVEKFRAEYENMLGEVWFLKENALFVLEYLKKRGYRQFAITNGTKRVQDKKIKGTGFDRIFEGVFISDEIGYTKPNNGFFDYVLLHIQDTPKEEMLIVGDSLTSDMKGGIINGIDTCWYNPGGMENPEGLLVNYHITDLLQVLEILEETYGEKI